MSPVTHFLTGWVFANVASAERRDRALVTLACVVPDVDGLGIIPELLTRSSAHPLPWFTLHHHRLHTLAFAVVVAMAAFLYAQEKWKIAVLAFACFHLHLLQDLVGSRGPDGYQWPIPYLAPFSQSAELTWRGQWALTAWPNFCVTVLLLLLALWLSWKCGFSPLEMISERADARFIHTLRQRFSSVRAI